MPGFQQGRWACYCRRRRGEGTVYGGSHSAMSAKNSGSPNFCDCAHCRWVSPSGETKHNSLTFHQEPRGLPRGVPAHSSPAPAPAHPKTPAIAMKPFSRDPYHHPLPKAPPPRSPPADPPPPPARLASFGGCPASRSQRGVIVMVVVRLLGRETHLLRPMRRSRTRRCC